MKTEIKQHTVKRTAFLLAILIPAIFLLASCGGGSGGNLLADTLLDGRALFSQEQLYQLSTFVDSTYVIGMVPCPKYDENQKDYRTFIHVAHSSSFSLPNLLMAERLKQTATVLEDMAYLSRDGVKHEYYDVNLTIRRAQDEESQAMLSVPEYALLSTFTDENREIVSLV